jgi:hypothetical protein
MAKLARVLGANRDLPQLELAAYASLAGGSATDPAQDILLAFLPDLTQSYTPSQLNQGTNALLADNRMWVREAVLISQGSAVTAGNATHYADLRLNVYRFQSTGLASGVNPSVLLQGCIGYYTLQVATTLGTAVTAAPLLQTVTPAAMTGIVPGSRLGIGTVASSVFEIVTVVSTTSTTFTAYFNNNHASNATTQSLLVPYLPIPLIPAYGPCNTTISSLSAGTSVTTTPATMYGIHVGDYLLVDTVASTVQETVQVQSVTATTFKATYANNHGSSAPIVTANTAVGVPRLANGPRFELLPHDVLALGRVSNDTTGIATPALMAGIDWVSSQIGQ